MRGFRLEQEKNNEAKTTMQRQNFHYDLPQEQIAKYPLSERSASRLLCLQAKNSLQHRHFYDVVDLLHEGDVLVFNDTKVIPARLLGKKITGGKVEVLVEKIIDRNHLFAQVFTNKAPQIDTELFFVDDIRLKIIAKKNQFYELFYEDSNKTIFDIVEHIGQIPLPPYMRRTAETIDHHRYQTVYAKHNGSVAAPTAGLHFDKSLLQALQKKNIQIAYLTLHIGAGTFTPVRVDDIRQHKMHAEFFHISSELCQQLNTAKQNGQRIIAVGTTTLRALEAAWSRETLQPYSGETDIFIYPGYTFHSADILITNLHLPGSTLLMLVCAFGGFERVMHAYKAAINHHYRFYSYGDAMWIERT